MRVGVAGETRSWLDQSSVGWARREGLTLGAVSVLAPRIPGYGPQGLPVNQTAEGAGVTESAVDPASGADGLRTKTSSSPSGDQAGARSAGVPDGAS